MLISDLAVDPGGRIDAPILSNAPLLDLKIQPRISPFLAEDEDGDFIVDTTVSASYSVLRDRGVSFRFTAAYTLFIHQQLSYIHGVSYPCNIPAKGVSSENLTITITLIETGTQLAKSSVPLNASDTLVAFSLTKIPPTLTPYNIILLATSMSGPTFNASTQLHLLPNPPSGSSVTKIDNLYNALLIRSPSKTTDTGTANTGIKGWTPLFPFSFYLDSRWLSSSPSNLARFAKKGYNILHVVPPVDEATFDGWVEEAEMLGLWLMFDMRHSYSSKEEATAQVGGITIRLWLLVLTMVVFNRTILFSRIRALI